MSAENNTKTAKLFSIYHSDGNDRQETYRFRAYDAQDIVNYITANWFIPDFQTELETDWQDENNVFIMWSNCDKDNCAEANNVEVDSEEEQMDLCAFCEVGQSSFEVSLIDNPEESDYKFITIEGANNFIDLTGEQPKQGPNWDNQLADTWKANPQAGANMLLIKSLIAKPKRLIGHTEQYDIYELQTNGQKLYYTGKTKEEFNNPAFWSLN